MCNAIASPPQRHHRLVHAAQEHRSSQGREGQQRLLLLIINPFHLKQDLQPTASPQLQTRADRQVLHDPDAIRGQSTQGRSYLRVLL